MDASFFKTGIHVPHQRLVFFNLVFSWALFFVSPSLCPPWDCLQVLVILFSSYKSIRYFSYVLSVPIFYSKIVLLPLHPVFDLSLCNLLRLFTSCEFFILVLTFLYFSRGVRSTSVHCMTLNHVIVRVLSCIFREYGVPLHCHYSQVHPDPDWQYLLGSPLWVK